MDYMTPTTPTTPNTSGQGSSAAIPPEIRGWNWGAFLLNFIWAIGNRTWIGLLALVPYAGLIMSIILGMKGNDWAWQNRQWDSVEHFKQVQGIWTRWGVIIFFASLIIGFIGAILIPVLFVAASKAAQSGM